ncbi:MAG: hypothetical protein HOP09_03125 [Hyphomicrobium sp.]|nr:hypothetical protein [Hyphomicrobium sp.]
MFLSAMPHFQFGAVRPLAGGLLACAVIASAAPASASETPGIFRPVVEVAQPDGPRDSLMHFLAALEGDAGTSAFNRAFGIAKAALTDQPAPAADIAPPGPRMIMVAAADPYFDRWQKDANERLKEEASGKKFVLHPLQAATPDVSVIVCEAGCRTLKDEVVYTAAYVPAVPPARTFEPASSPPNAGPAAEPALDEGSLPCIAGCYERPERPASSPRRQAGLHDGERTVVSASGVVEKRVPPPQLITGAIAPLTVAATPGRAVRAQQIGYNGAIVEVRPEQRKSVRTGFHKGRTALRLLKLRPAKATRDSDAKAKTLPGWRTTVVMVRPQEKAHKTPALRVLKHVRNAFRPARLARAGAH